MDEERAQRILDESFQTLERLQQRERENLFAAKDFIDDVRGAHFDPMRRTRHAPEPEAEEIQVRYSDPVRSPPPAPVEQPPVIGEDYLHETDRERRRRRDRRIRSQA
jgi:hypothetical protein